MSNTSIWDSLGKTDPSQTKGFNRSGGFKGTAIKPMWVMRRLTEQFGPCGIGWGVGEPVFQVVPAGDELLVFCTVSAWHGDHKSPLHGVGGDKVLTKRGDKPFADDEAFKKAFTDAVMNAFKFIGVAADVHMGLFDDSKYVDALKEEFREPEPAATFAIDQMRTYTTPEDFREFWDKNKAGLRDQLSQSEYTRVVKAMHERAAELAPPKSTTNQPKEATQ